MKVFPNIKSELYRETLVDRIVSLLEDRILSGTLRPNTKVSEAWVAKEFDVSRAPAREALQRLQDMNLVKKTHLSREVAQFNTEEFRELYELKNIVEAFGVYKGAQNASEQDLRKVRSLLNAMQAHVEARDVKRSKELNFQFHDHLVLCSRNQKLIQTYVLLAKQVRWIAPKSTFFQDRMEQTLKEHRQIFEAFENRDGAKARMLMEAHTNGSMERSLSQLRASQEQNLPPEVGKEMGGSKKPSGERAHPAV